MGSRVRCLLALLAAASTDASQTANMHLEESLRLLPVKWNSIKHAVRPSIRPSLGQIRRTDLIESFDGIYWDRLSKMAECE